MLGTPSVNDGRRLLGFESPKSESFVSAALRTEALHIVWIQRLLNPFEIGRAVQADFWAWQRSDDTDLVRSMTSTTLPRETMTWYWTEFRRSRDPQTLHSLRVWGVEPLPVCTGRPAVYNWECYVLSHACKPESASSDDSEESMEDDVNVQAIHDALDHDPVGFEARMRLQEIRSDILSECMRQQRRQWQLAAARPAGRLV